MERLRCPSTVSIAARRVLITTNWSSRRIANHWNGTVIWDWWSCCCRNGACVGLSSCRNQCCSRVTTRTSSIETTNSGTRRTVGRSRSFKKICFVFFKGFLKLGYVFWISSLKVPLFCSNLIIITPPQNIRILKTKNAKNGWRNKIFYLTQETEKLTNLSLFVIFQAGEATSMEDCWDKAWRSFEFSRIWRPQMEHHDLVWRAYGLSQCREDRRRQSFLA